MSICFYISSHGFGHAVRSTSIMHHLPESAPLIIKSGAPAWFFQDELNDRPFELFPDRFDCGAVQIDGIQVDTLATLQAARMMEERNCQRLSKEATFLKERQVRLVVADITPFACRVAKQVQVPSVVVTNFTWVEICEPMIAAHPEYSDILEIMRADYAFADLALIVPPHTAIDVFPCSEPAPMISRKGRDRRQELAAALGFDPAVKLFLVYVGELGLRGVDWKLLEQFDDAVFLSLHPLENACANLIHVQQGQWPHPDLTASCDAVIAKPGYGILGECLANGTPLVYTSREGFAEYFALDAALRQWGGGVFVPADDFHALRWRPYLQQINQRELTPPFPLDGAKHCADRIMQLYHDPQPSHN